MRHSKAPAQVLAEIQDHYTFGQPGIQRMVARLKSLVKRIDEELCARDAWSGR